MRSLNLLLLLVLTGTASAQLINGSFEDVDGPSLAGWEWTCDIPLITVDHAPGWGENGVAKQPGNAKGCFPSYLYQRLSGVQNGDLLTLSGWVRCGSSPCVSANIGLGSLQDGYFTLEETVGNSGMDWTFVTITDTVEVGENDTALVVLNSGFIGGPVGPEPGFFDGIEVSFSTSIKTVNVRSLQLLQIENGNTLVISTGDQRSSGISCFDLTGQLVPLQFEHNGTNAYRARISDLTSGLYILRANTETGLVSARFFKR